MGFVFKEEEKKKAKIRTKDKLFYFLRSTPTAVPRRPVDLVH